MGSTHTWLVGPHEPRLTAMVGNCCLPTYAGIEDHHLLHCYSNFIPGWKQYGDTPEIAALIAPRALHLNFGEKDWGSPIEEVRRGVARIAKHYAAAGRVEGGSRGDRQVAADAADRFSYYIQPEVGHVLSPQMWDKTMSFFDKHLRGGE